MKIKRPRPFTFEAGPRAVLLLHGFTGHTADVRMLGRYLEKKGYTTHAPIYRGHGVPPEELMETSPSEWWEDVVGAYQHLKDLGYEEIAVAGLSIGGVFSLKLAYSAKIKGVISMCTPMYFDNKTQLTQGFETFAKEYKQLEKKDEETITKEVGQLMEEAPNRFPLIKEAIDEVRENVDTIYTPTFVVQARNDQMINPESASFIYEHVETDAKRIEWYEHSGHVITLDKEKDKLHEDIYAFLEELNWKE
jgi:carboxylesterase